jgi:hypothetical protein
MARILISIGVAVAMTCLSIDASAQTMLPNPWQRGTLLSAFVGAGPGVSDTTATSGLGMGWEVTERFAVEGRGMWFQSVDGQSAFTALLLPRVSLLPSRAANPFVTAGVGMYRASFDAVSNDTPEFYRRRAAGGGLGSRTFDDFVVAIGAGVEVFASAHLALRPDVTMMLVTTRSDRRAVPVYGVHLEYYFESHDTAPSRR